MSSNLILKLIRIKMCLSPAEMAQKIGVSAKHYSKYGNDKTEFKMKEMIAISKITGMSMSDLF